MDDDIVRVPLILLTLVLGIILLPLGGYYLLFQNPLLFHSYTVLSSIYVLSGLLLVLSAIVGIYESTSYSSNNRQLVFSLIAFIILGLGWGGYQYRTTTVADTSTVPAISSLPERGFVEFFATSDYWSAPRERFTPDQEITVASEQPFHLTLGEVTAPSVNNGKGIFIYTVLTTNKDFSISGTEVGVTNILSKDALQVRLAKDTSVKLARIFLAVKPRNNEKLVAAAISNYYWNLAGNIGWTVVIIVGLGLGGWLVVLDHQKQKEKKKQAVIAKKQKLEALADKERKEAAYWKDQAKKKAENELKQRQEEFSKLVNDIDPDTLFED